MAESGRNVDMDPDLAPILVCSPGLATHNVQVEVIPDARREATRDVDDLRLAMERNVDVSKELRSMRRNIVSNRDLEQMLEFSNDMLRVAAPTVTTAKDQERVCQFGSSLARAKMERCSSGRPTASRFSMRKPWPSGRTMTLSLNSLMISTHDVNVQVVMCGATISTDRVVACQLSLQSVMALCDMNEGTSPGLSGAAGS